MTEDIKELEEKLKILKEQKDERIKKIQLEKRKLELKREIRELEEENKSKTVSKLIKGLWDKI